MRLRTCQRNEHQIPESCGQCPWCAIDDEREARRQRQVWAPGASGPQRLASPHRTGPLPANRGQAAPPKKINPAATGPVPRPAPAAPPAPRWQQPKVVLTALAIFVVTVLIVTAIIVWIILSGPPTEVAANALGVLRIGLTSGSP
jgi:DNA-binding helix-hairpin-helix protein with protein kinase domain